MDQIIDVELLRFDPEQKLDRDALHCGSNNGR
jgi:hypothetical protein